MNLMKRMKKMKTNMKHHNLFLTIGIICVILLGSYFAYENPLTMRQSIEQQASDKALIEATQAKQALVDTVYNSLPYNVLKELYFQIGDEAPKEYIVEEYLQNQDYYNNLD